MNSRAMSLSLIMAGVAVFFVMSSVSSIEDDAKKKFGDNVTVFVARTDIKEMDTIIDSSMEPKVIPRTFVEPTAIAFDTTVKENSNEYSMEVKRIVGNVAIVPIKKGEQLTLTKITDPNMKTGLAPEVTPGKRAMAIPVDEISGVAKLVKPGDRVDLIAVLDVSNGAGARESKLAKTVLQDVVILAVGRNITNNIARKIDVDIATGRPKVRSLTEYDGFTSVTLEVDPSQAQLMASIIASNTSRIILTLRNNADNDHTNLQAARPTDAFIDTARVPAQNNGNGGAR